MSGMIHMALALIQKDDKPKRRSYVLTNTERREIRVPCPVGERIGILTVIREGDRQEFPGCKQLYRTWVCRCDCGTVKTFAMTVLRQKNVKSCGCQHKGRFVKQDPRVTKPKNEKDHPWRATGS